MASVAVPVAKLGGVTLDASAGVSWALAGGTQPVVQVVECDKGKADRIRQGVPLDLTMEAAGERLTFQRLYVIGATASQDPHRAAFLLSDHRIWWQRKHVFRRYNIRTRSGERRRLNVDGEGIEELAQVVDDVTYKRFSLRRGTGVWTAQEVVEDVLNEVVGQGLWSGNLGAFTDRHVDSLEIDTNGALAVAQALSFLVGADVWMDETGRVQIYNAMAEEEAARQLKKLPPENEGSTHPAKVDLSKQRPHKVRVLLTPEAEVRFDYYGPDDTIAGDERWFEGVIPIPDLTLDVDGNTLVAGTYGETSKVLAAWTADKGGASVPDIDDAAVRDWWFFNGLESVWGQFDGTAPYANWMRRIAALRTHYRQTWRISRRWIQALHSFRPYRVALLDPETGAFAESRVFADYSVMFNIRGRLASGEGRGMEIGMNFDGGVTPSEPLTDGGIAQATLDVLDMEQGIVRFSYDNNYFQHYAEIAPSKCDALATVNAQDWNERPYFADGTRTEGQPWFKLAEDFNAAFVVTCVPGSPNSTDQLYAKSYSVQDVDDYLPIGVGIYGENSGPEWTVRIGPQIATARFAWSHDRAADIEAAFGVGGVDQGGSWDSLDDLLQNPKETEDLAKATAAALYASMADRWNGQHVGRLTPGIKPLGNIGRVTHTISTSGQASTAVNLTEPRANVDPMALLPESARRLFLREVQP